MDGAKSQTNIAGFQSRFLHAQELSEIAIGPIVGSAKAQDHLLLVLEPPSPDQSTFGSLLSALKTEQQTIRGAIASHGAILLRGFQVESASNFEEVCQSVGLELTTEYKPGIAPRRMRGKFAFTSTEAPGHIPVLPHTEMAYSSFRPEAIAFFCAEGPGREGRGETPIFDCHGIYTSLSPSFQEKLEQKHFAFERIYPGTKTTWDQAIQGEGPNGGVEKTAGGACWQAAFGTNSKSDVEAFCKKVGMEFSWSENELRTRIVLPQVTMCKHTSKPMLQLTTPLLGRVAYDVMAELFPERFAQSAKYWESVERGDTAPPVRLSFGDGEALTDAQVREMLEACWANSIIFSWRKGDVLLLDNFKVGHARMDCVQACPRKINVCMGDMIDLRYIDACRDSPADQEQSSSD